MKPPFISSVLFILLSACSNQSVYKGIQASQEEECRRLPPGQQEACFERLGTSYEEYQRQREELLED